ncbi:MAG: flagellar hook basal-body protein [Cyanobacteria bacterium HKST-UBA06]|nr:flagellar hook basal-body protein [Cyanobacteria bacterium HKST-UBA05]MCA9799613.1 flagellar hook basal-body protein [Cyanobacteria bacterium HKST-UBA04]MCA9806795.1 flagellar hook basal-body protein [Cyanobacteria bacterium HKST-UBA06]MCA9841422.1 flagellar hook basal-body protein [Cyanobacteria bacterium HKST-UBA03]
MFDAIMRQAADASTLNFDALDTVARNVSNLNTWGYKGQRFHMYLSDEQTVKTADVRDMEEGELMLTKRTLDVGVQGQGFIQITRPDGETAYTRFGSMTQNGDGFLTTPFGDLIGTGIQLPTNYHKIRIDRQGHVKLMEKPGDQYRTIGQIPLVNFPNPAALENIGYNSFQETDDSGKPVRASEATQLSQGYLERANVDIHLAVTEVLRINAGALSNLRLVKLIDQLYQEAVNLRQ